MRVSTGSVSLFLAAGLPAALGAGAQSSQPITVALQRSPTVLLIVEARINGAGPYKFVLDTGTDVSLVEGSLFHELGLQPEGAPATNVVGGMRLGSWAVAHEISIDRGIARKDVEVLEVEGTKRTDLGPSVRGVLGENFLSAFDLLIDNRRHRIVFDSGGTLASALSGERVALRISSSVEGEEVPNRPLVAASVPSFDPDHPVQLLISTASEGATMLPRPGNTPQHPAEGSDRHSQFALLHGGTVCSLWTGPMQLGRTMTPAIKMSSCGQPALSDHDGQLPTFLFARVFISHTHQYVIFNPTTAP